MQNLANPSNSSNLNGIQSRTTVPTGFTEFTEAKARKFGLTAEELARRTAPGAFVRVDGKVYFSAGNAAACSHRVA